MTGASGPPPPPGDADPAQLSALLAELQATAEQLGAQLGDLGRASADAAAGRAEHIPAVRRILEIAPPELRARLAAAAQSGLSATRDLADWLLAQMSPQVVRPEPEELTITPIRPAPTLQRVPTTWILTTSVANHRTTERLGFSVIGIKQAHHRRALEMEQGDLIVTYLTKVMAFASAVRITGDLHEDREPIWPGKSGAPDLYPWRFETEPVVALPQERWIKAALLKDDLEHVQKWPAENWTLALQGQLRAVSEHDSELLLGRLGAAAGQPA